MTTCAAILVHGAGGFACELRAGHHGQHTSGHVCWLGEGCTECPEGCSDAHSSDDEADEADEGSI